MKTRYRVAIYGLVGLSNDSWHDSKREALRIAKKVAKPGWHDDAERGSKIEVEQVTVIASFTKTED